MLEIKLYTKTGCSLCDVVKAQLNALKPTFPHHLIQVDIEKDLEQFNRYRYKIPVLEFQTAGRTEILEAPITLSNLQAIFRQLNKI